MKIICAKNIGFCSGVRRALQIAEKSLKDDPRPVQFLGEVIHNEKITGKIKKKGGKLILDPKAAKSGTLVVRAHGAAPFRLSENILIRDATCPLVKRVHLIVSSLHQAGFKVIIIGDKKHVETKAVKAYAKNQALIIENENQARRLPKFKKIGIVVQTTQDREKVNRILKILATKAGKIKFYNTICPEVQARQRGLKEILEKAKGILIVGSRTSANTNRLADIAKKFKKPVWRINSIKELKKLKFKNIPVLGLVSGTSAPDSLIREVVKKLKNK